MKKITSLIISTVLILSLISIQPKAATTMETLKYSVPVVDTTNVGYGIQRTMRLLETSTAENRNTVRIAFCGQSITDGNNNIWPSAIIDFLKNKYPNADIQSMNFGIGGFNTSLQSNIIENDISSFYPDLVFFYVYGNKGTYNDLVHYIRENTVSEVIIQNEHLDDANGIYGSDTSSYTDLPLFANTTNSELVDIRTYWKKYIDDNKLVPRDFLSDNVHLNAQGQALMFQLLKQFLVYKPVDEATYDDRVDIYQIGKDINWEGDKLTLPFNGNRIEMTSSTDNNTNSSVTINGKKPSEYLELYNHSRYTNLENHVFQSYYMKIEFLKPVVPQTWEMEFTKVNPQNGKDCDFKITGSISGLQGTGNTLVDFTTNDGSMLFRKERFYSLTAPFVGKKLIFNTTLNGTDQATFNGTETLASNLPKRNNTLTLASSAAKPTNAFLKVYHPGILLSAPRVNPIKIGDKHITGFSNKRAKITVNIGGSEFTGTTGRDGKFDVEVPAVPAGVIVEAKAVLDGIPSQIFRVKMEGTAPKPVIKKAFAEASSGTVISGVASNGSNIEIKAGSKTYTTKASTKNGTFSVKASSLKPGTVVKLTAAANGVKSNVKSIKVQLAAPTLKKVTKKSKSISGKAYPKGVVTVKYDGKLLKKVSVSSKGTFSIKVKNLKVNKKVTANVKFGKFTSKTTTVKVRTK